jgi:hypothetical protein
MTPESYDFDDSEPAPDTRLSISEFVPAPRPQAVMGRTLPHSIEAEEALLGAIFADYESADVLTRCVAAGITPDSFYDVALGTVFRAICDLHTAGVAADTSSVAESLKAQRKLDAIGGYTTLMRVSNVPTSAQAGFFLQRVRDLALLRELIRTATGVVEDCHNATGDIPAFAKAATDRIQHIVENATLADLAEIKKRQFCSTREIPKPAPIYSVSDTTICTPGNLTTIYSQAKTGKSSFLGAMIGATMTTPTSNCDTLGVTGPNYQKHAVLHFDTEQSPYDWQQLIRSVLRRVGLTEQPPWLMSFTIAGMEASKAEQFIISVRKLARKLHGGIHSEFIDGVADLVNDPNDPAECFPLVCRLQGAAIEFNHAIITILHMNPGSDTKGRGHLGSQLERKSESNLTLHKEGDTTTVLGDGRQRGKPIPSDKSPSFKWSDEHHMHRSCGTPAGVSSGRSESSRVSFSFSMFRSVIPEKTGTPLTISQLARACSTNHPIKVEKLAPLVAEWVQQGELEKIERPGSPILYRKAH